MFQTAGSQFDIMCFSLEPWDQVWRRNQFLVSELLAMDPGLRVLFVEPPADVTWSVAHRRTLSGAGLRPIGDSGRLWALTLRKWLPRRLAPGVDRRLGRRAVTVAARLGLSQPLLWINDSSYASLAEDSGWPSVYDVTDDWLLGGYPGRELDRQHRNDDLLLRVASEVVVCSPSLAESRGRERHVHLVPNGVDSDHFRRAQARPADMPAGRIVLYTGTLSGGRLDLDLCVELAQRVAPEATLVFVGPNACSADETARLVASGATLLGARPYDLLPGYLQHADVLVVPHAVSPFTESLDPIKAREFLAVGRPSVSTPVAGFRELAGSIVIADADTFPQAVLDLLRAGVVAPGAGHLAGDLESWSDRAQEFMAVLATARGVAQPAVVEPVGE